MKNSLKKKRDKNKTRNIKKKKGGKRTSRNNSKIRVQFLNSRATTTPYSIITVTKGPTTGVFDYMWYNIDNIEEMLSTAMYGLKTDPPLPSEIVYNVIPNDKSDDKLNKDKSDEDDSDSKRTNKRGLGLFNEFDYR